SKKPSWFLGAFVKGKSLCQFVSNEHIPFTDLPDGTDHIVQIGSFGKVAECTGTYGAYGINVLGLAAIDQYLYAGIFFINSSKRGNSIDFGNIHFQNDNIRRK